MFTSPTHVSKAWAARTHDRRAQLPGRTSSRLQAARGPTRLLLCALRLWGLRPLLIWHACSEGIWSPGHRARARAPSAAGMSHVIGTVEAGKLADLVLWSPADFGERPPPATARAPFTARCACADAPPTAAAFHGPLRLRLRGPTAPCRLMLSRHRARRR